MFFANGQKYNVVISAGGVTNLMHEPMPLIPRKGEWFSYAGACYRVNDVGYRYSISPSKVKMTVYLDCDTVSMPAPGQVVP